MKASITTLFIVAFLAQAFAQTEAERQKHFNLKKNLALEGYDAVSYFNNRPIEGKENISLTYKGVVYQFSSQANLTTFKSNPGKYEPAYGGWCAYAMGENGEKVKVDPETFKILNGKLYLFYNFWANNTLTSWNKNEAKLKSAADSNWKKFVP
jgi:YHS domain-containing protein